MKDKLSTNRLKSRFIVEIRHEPMLDILDRKGEIISTLHPDIKTQLKHWKVQNNEIAFVDSLQLPINIAFVDLKRFGMVFENISGLVEFKNFFSKFLYPAYNKFYKDIAIAQRIGFRILSVLVKEEEEEFDVINANIIGKFFQKLPIDAPAKDSKVHITLENGYYLVGPISKEREEPWIHEHFGNKTVDQNGYGVDIDSYANNVDISSLQKFQDAILALLDYARSLEEQLAIYLKIINK